MFDIGFPELLLAAAIALVVIGPRRLPGAMSTLGNWIGAARRSFIGIRRQIEKEIGLEAMQKQLSEAAAINEINEIKETGFKLDELVDETGKSADDGGDPSNWPGMPPDSRK
jgi:sec-independent protein translocase protein TatB